LNGFSPFSSSNRAILSKTSAISSRFISAGI